MILLAYLEILAQVIHKLQILKKFLVFLNRLIIISLNLNLFLSADPVITCICVHSYLWNWLNIYLHEPLRYILCGKFVEGDRKITWFYVVFKVRYVCVCVCAYINGTWPERTGFAILTCCVGVHDFIFYTTFDGLYLFPYKKHTLQYLSYRIRKSYELC